MTGPAPPRPRRFVVDLQAGTETWVELTDAEIEQRRLDEAAEAIADAEDTAEAAAAATLRQDVGQAIATIEAAVADWATITPAQKDAAARLTAKVAVALTRLELRQFS